MAVTVGTLSDKEIKRLCKQGKLINDNYDEKHVKQSCYELRAGNIYYDISDSAKKYNLSDDEYILIKPKQVVVVITNESINLSKDVLGRILSKGSLFSIGISPVNTYADPGFFGNLGIVLNNLSTNYIKIKPKECIAKIEFSKLQEGVQTQYNGQHGYQTNIWPIRDDLIMTEEEIKKDERIFKFDTEIELSYGKNISGAISRVFRYERYLIGSIILYLTFTILLITFMTYKDVAGDAILSPLLSLSLGVCSNIIFGIISFVATSKIREKRK